MMSILDLLGWTEFRSLFSPNVYKVSDPKSISAEFRAGILVIETLFGVELFTLKFGFYDLRDP